MSTLRSLHDAAMRVLKKVKSIAAWALVLDRRMQVCRSDALSCYAVQPDTYPGSALAVESLLRLLPFARIAYAAAAPSLPLTEINDVSLLAYCRSSASFVSSAQRYSKMEASSCSLVEDQLLHATLRVVNDSVVTSS